MIGWPGWPNDAQRAFRFERPSVAHVCRSWFLRSFGTHAERVCGDDGFQEGIGRSNFKIGLDISHHCDAVTGPILKFERPTPNQETANLFGVLALVSWNG